MSAGYSETPLAKKLGVRDGQRTLRLDIPASVAAEVSRLRPLLAPAGMIWVSWPKKAAKVDTDITEEVVRDACLPTSLVDVKVCAVDAVWSGLKLVLRREMRG